MLSLALGTLALFAFAQTAVRFRDVRVPPAQDLCRRLVIRTILAIVYEEHRGGRISKQFLDRRPHPHSRTTRIFQVKRYLVLHTEAAEFICVQKQFVG